MTPYTIRERAANIAKHSHPEAYPGQNAKLLTDLIESDVARAAAERERAAEARHGGRYITGELARMSVQHPEALASLRAGEYPDAWRYHLSPSGSQGNGADTTASLAQSYASGRNDPNTGFPPKAPRVTLAEAEAMMSWPIYRAAMAAECWLWDNGLAMSRDGNDRDVLAGYMTDPAEQAVECRNLRGDAPCPVHGRDLR